MWTVATLQREENADGKVSHWQLLEESLLRFVARCLQGVI